MLCVPKKAVEIVKERASIEFNQEGFVPLQRQIEQAEKFFSVTYQRLQNELGEYWEEIRQNFDDDESFYREFVVPLMINSYNAGAARVGKLFKAYADDYTKEDVVENWPKGYDLFITFRDFAKVWSARYTAIDKKKRTTEEKILAEYVDEAGDYVPNIYGIKDAMGNIGLTN
jgi:hypothetical protein